MHLKGLSHLHFFKGLKPSLSERRKALTAVLVLQVFGFMVEKG
jgi:hypothetical protein